MRRLGHESGTGAPCHAMRERPERGVLEDGQFVEQVCEVKASIARNPVDAVFVSPCADGLRVMACGVVWSTRGTTR
jgi:hypothetical protein